MIEPPVLILNIILHDFGSARVSKQIGCPFHLKNTGTVEVLVSSVPILPRLQHYLSFDWEMYYALIPRLNVTFYKLRV